MIRTILFILAVFLLASCEKTVILDLQQMQPKVVIEGVVTNQPGYQYVKVSRSVNFYQTGSAPRVTDAMVFVDDKDGNRTYYLHNPRNHADSMGYYLPAEDFAGQIGSIYKLVVEVDDVSYEAEDALLPVTRMDSVKYQVNVHEQDDPKGPGQFYELLMYAKEPQETHDYYLFKFFRNDSLTQYSPTDIYFSDDKILGEEIKGIPSPVFYSIGDKAQVEMHSLSRTGFVYYSDLEKLLNNDGGMFSPPAATPRTNLSNGALGFFRVSAVDVANLRIE